MGMKSSAAQMVQAGKPLALFRPMVILEIIILLMAHY
jgi:hypothetical protein